MGGSSFALGSIMIKSSFFCFQPDLTKLMIVEAGRCRVEPKCFFYVSQCKGLSFGFFGLKKVYIMGDFEGEEEEGEGVFVGL